MGSLSRSLCNWHHAYHDLILHKAIKFILVIATNSLSMSRGTSVAVSS